MRQLSIGWVIGAGLVLALAGCRAGAPTSAETREPAVRESRHTQIEAQSVRRGYGGRQRGEQGSPAGEFDYYLLNLSWSPEFCVTHPQSEECASRPGFIVHGLWPQNADGGYPGNCDLNASGPGNPGALHDVMPNDGLIAHEWRTHGTCSGLEADAYFNALRRAFHEVVIPPRYTKAQGETMLTPEQILSEFRQANPTFPEGSIAVSCGNNRLTAIEVCMTKDLRPEACQGVRSCRANAVKITGR